MQRLQSENFAGNRRSRRQHGTVFAKQKSSAINAFIAVQEHLPDLAARTV
jgi:hypothetical protein